MSDYILSEMEILLAIVRSPRFKKECKKLIQEIEDSYNFTFPNLPLNSKEELDNLLGKLVSKSIVEDNYTYSNGLNELMQSFNLDPDNKLHKNVVKNAFFFNLEPDPNFRPYPNFIWDSSEKTTRIYLEVFPWTTKEDIWHAFKHLKKAIKKGKLKLLGMSNGNSQGFPLKKLSDAKERYKPKEDYPMLLDIYFLYKKYERKVERGVISTDKVTSSNNPIKSKERIIFNNPAFKRDFNEITKGHKIKRNYAVKTVERIHKHLENLELLA